MTDAQFEQLKREQLRNRSLDTRRIEDVFPNIELIEIHYNLHHSSPFGRQDEEMIRNINPHSQMDLTIDCLNRECTSAGESAGLCEHPAGGVAPCRCPA